MLGSCVGNTKGEIELDRLLPGLLAFVLTPTQALTRSSSMKMKSMLVPV